MKTRSLCRTVYKMNGFWYTNQKYVNQILLAKHAATLCSGWKTSQPWTFPPQASTLDLLTPDFSTINFWAMGLKSSWLKSLGLKHHLSRRLKDISKSDFLTMNFSTPLFKHSWLKSPGLKSSWSKILELKLGVKKSGVEMSINPRNIWMVPLTIRCNYNVSNSLIGSPIGHVVGIGDFDKIFAFATPILVKNVLQGYGFNSFFCIFVLFRYKKIVFCYNKCPDLLSEKKTL